MITTRSLCCYDNKNEKWYCDNNKNENWYNDNNSEKWYNDDNKNDYIDDIYNNNNNNNNKIKLTSNQYNEK